ncbi:hypothetical protein [Bacillus toyonensis]|uniref:hypothetical protein n=1 Tax=Bacillus toyonensis TaxID=155322 RepID=UPI000BF4F363|nr:hypothetical protein [Bacillus toyonensis]PGF05245.1 hypothetical protein COM61_02185 [Bacillus toyonensis]
MAVVTEQELRNLYEVQGKTDRQIAEECGVDRTRISQLRKQWGINTRPTVFDKGIKDVTDKLESLGFKVENVKKEDKTANYDLLLNDSIKVEVRTSSTIDRGRQHFRIVEQASTGVVESDVRIKLKNGHFRKLFRRTCDYIIFVGYEEGNINYWVMRSSTVTDTIQSLGLNISPLVTSKFDVCRDAWHTIL